MRKRTLIAVGIMAVLGVLAAACELSTIGGTDVPLDLECEQNEVLGFGPEPDAEIVCLDPVDAVARAMRGLEPIPSADAEECVTTERFYSDGTSEINAYGPGCPDGTEGTNVSTIGGADVPTGLDCAEDTVISFTGVDTLGCVHYEAITCDALFSESDAWRNGQIVGGDIAAACEDYAQPDASTGSDVDQCQAVTDKMRAINSTVSLPDGERPLGGLLSALGAVNDSVCDATPAEACAAVTASVGKVQAHGNADVLTADQNAALADVVAGVCN